MNDQPVKKLECPPEIYSALETVHDPEVGLNLVELGLIYKAEEKDGTVRIQMTVTHPSCPMGGLLEQGVKNAILKLPGIQECQVQIVFDPPWDPSMIHESGRRRMGLIPPSPS